MDKPEYKHVEKINPERDRRLKSTVQRRSVRQKHYVTFKLIIRLLQPIVKRP